MAEDGNTLSPSSEEEPESSSRFPELEALQSEIQERIRDNQRFLKRFMDEDFEEELQEEASEEGEDFEEL